MKSPRLAFLALVLGAASTRLAEQYTSGYMDSANCSTVTGWAWDSTQPNTPINVDLYDYNVPVATVPANIFRSDLLAAGVGNGYHGFSFTVPPYLKDGHLHGMVGYIGGTKITLYYTKSFN